MLHSLPALAGLATLVLFTSTAQGAGSGSKASQSLLALDAPLDDCLLAGAELWEDLEVAEAASIAPSQETREEADADSEDAPKPAHTLVSAQNTQIWALTFDQTWLEVSYEEGFFFVSAPYVSHEVCEQ